MNPLPNRPLLNNPSLSLALPNVPPFDPMPYGSRPRKVLPENGKEFPILTGVGVGNIPSSSSVPQPSVISSERIQPQHTQAPQPALTSQPQPNPGPPQTIPSNTLPPLREKEGELDVPQIPSVFRQDDAGK